MNLAELRDLLEALPADADGITINAKDSDRLYFTMPETWRAPEPHPFNPGSAQWVGPDRRRWTLRLDNLRAYRARHGTTKGST